MGFTKSIKNWFSRLLEKIEWHIPYRLLTHKAKIRRIVVLEDKFPHLKIDGPEDIPKEMKDALELISQPDQSSSQSTGAY